MYFTWDPSLDTGIEIIDEQHKRIVDYINTLHDAVGSKDSSKVGDVIDQLLNYTISHFSFEESLMETHGYQHTAAHSKVHEMFTRRIETYKSELDQGKDVSRKLLNDLRIWLTSHIKSEDADYVAVIADTVDKGWVSKMLGRFFN